MSSFDFDLVVKNGIVVTAAVSESSSFLLRVPAMNEAVS
jgi:hypothetical protein